MSRLDKPDTPLSLAFDTLFVRVCDDDPQLAHRMKVVLRRLNTLATGPSSRYAVDITTGSSASSAPPRGAFDPNEASPFHTFFHKFASAPNLRALEGHVEDAEVECARFQGGDADQYHGTLGAKVRAARRSADEPEEEANAIERVCAWYEGLSPEQAARREGDERLAEWIRKARRIKRRDEETGEARRGWDGWDDDARTENVRRLWDQGVGRDKAAERLGVSPRTIQRYWPGRVDRRRAA